MYRMLPKCLGSSHVTYVFFCHPLCFTCANEDRRALRLNADSYNLRGIQFVTQFETHKWSNYVAFVILALNASVKCYFQLGIEQWQSLTLVQIQIPSESIQSPRLNFRYCSNLDFCLNQHFTAGFKEVLPFYFKVCKSWSNFSYLQ